MNTITKADAEALAYSFGTTLPDQENGEFHLITTQSGHMWWLTFWNGEYKLTDAL